MLVAGHFDEVWLYLLAPALGGVLAAVIAEFLLRGFQMEQEDDDETVSAHGENTGARRLGTPIRRPVG
jgi:hypothetical protein